MAIFDRAPHASRQKILNPLCGTEDFVFPVHFLGKTKELHSLLVGAERRSRHRGPARPVAPSDGTGVAPGDGTGACRACPVGRDYRTGVKRIVTTQTEWKEQHSGLL